MESIFFKTRNKTRLPTFIALIQNNTTGSVSQCNYEIRHGKSYKRKGGSQKALLEPIYEFSKIARYKNQYTKLVAFQYTNNKFVGKNHGNNPIHEGYKTY